MRRHGEDYADAMYRSIEDQRGVDPLDFWHRRRANPVLRSVSEQSDRSLDALSHARGTGAGSIHDATTAFSPKNRLQRTPPKEGRESCWPVADDLAEEEARPVADDIDSHDTSFVSASSASDGYVIDNRSGGVWSGMEEREDKAAQRIQAVGRGQKARREVARVWQEEEAADDGWSAAGTRRTTYVAGHEEGFSRERRQGLAGAGTAAPVVALPAPISPVGCPSL